MVSKINMGSDPVFFAEPADFGKWLEEHHSSAPELWVGFHKKGTGNPSITWPESVVEALCFGWIDGVRKSLGASSYMIRFTPRKPGSIWSTVNIEYAEQLISSGRMQPDGLKAYELRKVEKSSIYAYEQKEEAKLDNDSEKQFRSHAKAWEFFQSQPAWYRKQAIYRVTSAKREETRLKRLTALIESSEQGRRI
jgi:uncharacterized protein YdeI (YjbR/CyaY-like superfamily)